MSIADDIRNVLRAGPGPMTSGEIREACDEDYTAEQIGGAVNSMYISGELVRDGEGRGKFTYVLDSSYQPKRAPKDESPPPKKTASPPLVANPATQHSTPNGKRATAAPLPVIREAVITNGQVALPRDELRTIVYALIARHPEPMPAELRAAVVGAIQSTL